MEPEREPFQWFESGRLRDRAVVRYVGLGVVVAALYELRTRLRGWDGAPAILIEVLRALVTDPFRFFQLVIASYFSLWIFWRARRRVPGARGIELAPATDPEVLAAAVSNVLGSSHFLTTLRDALPGSDAPERDYLAHVPYILRTINDRREAVALDARGFLRLTVAAGGVFAGVVIYYGYILVNETAAGFPAAVSDLRTATDEIRVLFQMHADGGRLVDRPDAPEVLRAIEQLHATGSAGTERLAGWSALQPALENAQKWTATAAAVSSVDAVFRAQESDGTLAVIEAEATGRGDLRDAAGLYLKVAPQVRTLSEAISREQEEIAARLALLDSVASRADEKANESSSRVAEIVKRATVGLVVSSFLLAILRYLAGLYREARSQVSNLVEQELRVRRVCVALASMDAGAGRDAVIRRFASERTHSGGDTAEAGLEEAAERDKELLRELVKVLGKKLE